MKLIIISWFILNYCSWYLVISNSSWTHGLQCTKLLCPSLSPRLHSNSWPLSWWCHPTISPSVTPFSTCAQSFPASGIFPMSQLFPSGGQSIGVSALASVITVNSQGWLLLGLTSMTSSHFKGLSRVFCSTTV